MTNKYLDYISKIYKYLEELKECFTSPTKVKHIYMLLGQIDGTVDDLCEAIDDEIKSCSIIFIEESQNRTK